MKYKYRYTIGAPGGTGSQSEYDSKFYHLLLQGKNSGTNFEGNTLPTSGLVESAAEMVTNSRSDALYVDEQEAQPIIEMTKKANGLYNLAIYFTPDNGNTYQKCWIGSDGQYKEYLTYVPYNTTAHSADPNTITSQATIADLDLHWKDNGDGTGYYQIWWGNKILKAKNINYSKIGAARWVATFRFASYFTWSDTEGNSFSHTLNDTEARLYMSKKSTSINNDTSGLFISATPDGEKVKVTTAGPSNTYGTKRIIYILSHDYNANSPISFCLQKLTNGQPVNTKHLSTKCTISSNSYGKYDSPIHNGVQLTNSDEYILFTSIGNGKLNYTTAGGADYSDRSIPVCTIDLKTETILFDDDYEAVLASSTYEIEIRTYQYDASSSEMYAVTVPWLSNDTEIKTLNKNYDNTAAGEFNLGFGKSNDNRAFTIPDSFTAIDGLTKLDNGNYKFENSPVWNFSSGNPYIDIPLQRNIVGYYAGYYGKTTIVGQTKAATLRVKPYQPQLTLEKNQIQQNGGDEWTPNETLTVSIPQGMFEAGDNDSQYARILLTPMFDTFDNADAAAEYYGTPVRPGVKDTWLDHSWFKNKNLSGFLPSVEWNADTKCYDCLISPTEMTYVDWEGNISKGHSLVSGYYSLRVIPSLTNGHEQYGVIPSDPVDLYIYPPLEGLNLSLCVRDTPTGEPYWKDYPFYLYDMVPCVEGPDDSSDHGKTAYAHARITSNACDFPDIWYQTGRFYAPAKPNVHNSEAKINAATPTGYKKLEQGEYINISNGEDLGIMIGKNGAVNPEPAKVKVYKYYGSIITGIEEVLTDDSTTQAEYYTPAGIHVADPKEPGIYIKFKGGKSRKVVLR